MAMIPILEMCKQRAGLQPYQRDPGFGCTTESEAVFGCPSYTYDAPRAFLIFFRSLLQLLTHA